MTKHMAIPAPLVVFLVAALFAGGYMTLCVGTTGPQYDTRGAMLMPAAMWAAGHGLRDIDAFNKSMDYRLLPRVADFIEQRSLQLEAKDLPLWGLGISIGDKFISDRLYLLYAVGITWRLFGISWVSLNILIALSYGIVAALVYSIFRLGMGRALSVAGTSLSMSSPLVLQVLPCIRDFCKAPFILATILVVGYLLSRPVRRRPFLLVSIALGIAIGIGIGFRQDSFICLPPALVAVLLLAHGERITRCIKLLSAGLLLAAFTASAWPTLTMTHDTGGNNAFYLLQGFSLTSQQSMEIQRASYAPLVDTRDMVVHANVCTYDHVFPSPQTSAATQNKLDVSKICFLSALVNMPTNRLAALSWLAFDKVFNFIADARLPLDLWSKNAEHVARSLVWNLATTFPADVISKWYAATARNIHNPQNRECEAMAPNGVLRTLYLLHLPIQSHLTRYGDFYALATLLLLATRDARLAIVGLLVVVYFCGYSSLSFQLRHVFHLAFLGFWFPGFVLQRILNAHMQLAASRRQLFSDMRSASYWLLPTKRIVIFLAVAVILGSVPLYLARLWQDRQVSDIVKRYKECQLEPLPFEEQASPENALCVQPAGVTDRVPAHRWLWELAGVPTEPIPGLMVEYLAADIEVTGSRPDMCISTTYEYQQWDFGKPLDVEDTYDISRIAPPFRLRYFFPVYRYMAFGGPDYLPKFKGLTVPNNVKVTNVYRVKNPDAFPMLMNMWLFERPELCKWYQAVPLLHMRL